MQNVHEVQLRDGPRSLQLGAPTTGLLAALHDQPFQTDHQWESLTARQKPRLVQVTLVRYAPPWPLPKTTPDRYRHDEPSQWRNLPSRASSTQKDGSTHANSLGPPDRTAPHDDPFHVRKVLSFSVALMHQVVREHSMSV